MPYQQIKRYLQSPRRIVLGEVELVQRLLRDCNIPEDPDWPSPRARYEVEPLMHRLPHWAKVVCAITAAEMVLPIWDDWAENRNDLTIQQKGAPRRAIDAAKQWLDEEIVTAPASRVARAADAADAADVADAAEAAAYAVDAYAAAEAADAAADAANAAAYAANAAYADAAVIAADAAAYAGDATDDHDGSFYLDWWRVCRCRLAFILEARPF